MDIAQLRLYADKYETKEFIFGDPSFFMHQVEDDKDKETIAFIASCFSYGSRKQFMPKIEQFLLFSEGHIYEWVKDGNYKNHIKKDRNQCFYRLNTQLDVFNFLERYQTLLNTYGTLKEYIRLTSDHNAQNAIKSICSYFASCTNLIPKDTTSACKRICMFLRWMVRDNSPVDIGLWSDIIDKRTLIMPLDTHVLRQANNLQLIKSTNATFQTAIKLTLAVQNIFPDDPLKADFALFGYGIDGK